MEYISHVAAEGEEVVEHVSAVLRPLYELVQQVPSVAVTWAREFIASIHEQLQGTAWPAFPRLRQLIVFQVLPLLFSRSDHWHAVITPAVLVMTELLTQCHVQNLRSVGSGVANQDGACVCCSPLAML